MELVGLARQLCLLNITGCDFKVKKSVARYIFTPPFLLLDFRLSCFVYLKLLPSYVYSSLTYLVPPPPPPSLHHHHRHVTTTELHCASLRQVELH